MRWLAILSGLLLVCPGAGRAAECTVLPAPYDGPIFDANVQAWTSDVQDLLAAAPRAGVKRLALFANSRVGGAETVAAVLKAAREHPDLVVPGAPKIGFIHIGDLPGDFVALTVAGIADGTYKFVGEILYTHGDKPDHPPTRRGEVDVDPLGAETKHLLEGLAGRNAPLLTHWEAWAWERDRLRFDRLYASWPQQRFVVPSLVYGSPEKAEALLSMHPNLWGTISRLVDGRFRLVDPDKMAKLGPVMFDSCGALTPAWRAVLLKHADRLMYGSDDYATERTSWQSYPHIIARYRKIAGQLPPDIARKISWDTAAALYGGR
ncbi:MAG TPA: amidohydrolase family protein [Stellaceae bacterium]|nr:amidohydrolase family protein [Stellaceae bacterium]